jgi:hypothetical protein
MEVKDIKPGMVFRYKSKYDNHSYIGVVDVLNSSWILTTNFLANNGVVYKTNEVEWIDEIREDKLNQLLNN